MRYFSQYCHSSILKLSVSIIKINFVSIEPGHSSLPWCGVHCCIHTKQNLMCVGTAIWLQVKPVWWAWSVALPPITHWRCAGKTSCLWALTSGCLDDKRRRCVLTFIKYRIILQCVYSWYSFYGWSQWFWTMWKHFTKPWRTFAQSCA